MPNAIQIKDLDQIQNRTSSNETKNPDHRIQISENPQGNIQFETKANIKQRKNNESPRSKEDRPKLRAKYREFFTDLEDKWEKGLNEKLTEIEERRFEGSVPK